MCLFLALSHVDGGQCIIYANGIIFIASNSISILKQNRRRREGRGLSLAGRSAARSDKCMCHHGDPRYGESSLAPVASPRAYFDEWPRSLFAESNARIWPNAVNHLNVISSARKIAL